MIFFVSFCDDFYKNLTKNFRGKTIKASAARQNGGLLKITKTNQKGARLRKIQKNTIF